MDLAPAWREALGCLLLGGMSILPSVAATAAQPQAVTAQWRRDGLFQPSLFNNECGAAKLAIDTVLAQIHAKDKSTRCHPRYGLKADWTALIRAQDQNARDRISAVISAQSSGPAAQVWGNGLAQEWNALTAREKDKTVDGEWKTAYAAQAFGARQLDLCRRYSETIRQLASQLKLEVLWERESCGFSGGAIEFNFKYLVPVQPLNCPRAS